MKGFTKTLYSILNRKTSVAILKNSKNIKLNIAKREKSSPLLFLSQLVPHSKTHLEKQKMFQSGDFRFSYTSKYIRKNLIVHSF